MLRIRHALGLGLDLAVGLIVPLLILGTLFLGRGPAASAQAGATAQEPSARLASAAGILEQATAKSGPGYTFEIIQRSTIHARAGGPRIEIPDPIDRNKSLGFADAYDVGSLIERGAVTPDGFWMEMRTGPAPGKEADWTAPYQFGAIERDGKTFRDDGVGWYATDDPPGIGLDPRTAALLPGLLRNATSVADTGSKPVDGATLATVSGSAKVADIPGIIAADGAPFTELVAPLDFAFDAEGRLAQVHVLARNMNLDGYDLLIDTTITFAYPAAAAELPQPLPVRPASADVVVP